MNTYRLHALFAVVLSLVMVGTSAHSTMISFNSTSDLANNFVLNNFTGTPGAQPGGEEPTNISNGGLSATGSVLPSNTSGLNQAGTEVFNTSRPFASAQYATLSMYFQATAITGAGSTALQLGLVNALSGSNVSEMRLGGGGPYLEVDVFANSAPNIWTLNLRSSTGSGALTPLATVGVPLTAGNWYKLQGDFVNLGGGNVSLAATLYNSDSAGVLGSLVNSLGPTPTVNGTINSTVFGAFRGYAVSGASHYDNFLFEGVIPEPSTTLLLAVGGFWISRSVRQKKSSAHVS